MTAVYGCTDVVVPVFIVSVAVAEGLGVTIDGLILQLASLEGIPEHDNATDCALPLVS